MHAAPGHNAAPIPLRSYVDRYVRLQEQINDLKADQKDIVTEAASTGFDKRVVKQMAKEAMMTSDQRAAQREYEEICEVYRANLGMLGGTPLGEAARKRAAAKSPPRENDDVDRGDEAATTAEPDAPSEPAMPEEDIDAAREKGGEAARSGVKIFANPYVAGDPRRAAWDEGHCEASGSDGMDIPESWRRRSKKKPGKGEPGEAP